MKDMAFIDRDIDKRIEKHKYGNRLYHYTSIATLHSILKNKQFWLGNTATMNDSKEVKHFIELLRNELRDNISADKLDQCNEFFAKVFARIEKEYPYAMCFSKLEDDAAQWERYADGAKDMRMVRKGFVSFLIPKTLCVPFMKYISCLEMYIMILILRIINIIKFYMIIL